MDVLKSMFKSNVRQYGMIVALVAITVLFQIMTDGILLKPLNVTNIIQQYSFILVLAIGMVMVIITGHIDLSVGSVAAFVGAVAAVMMVDYGMPFYVVIVLSLIIGGLVGAWQGFWIAYMKIPSFIVTLAGMLIFRGLTMDVLDGQSIAPFPKLFQKMSNGFLPDFGDGKLHTLSIVLGIGLSILTILQEIRDRRTQQKYGFDVLPLPLFYAKLVAIAAVINLFTYVLAQYKGIPFILIILFVLVVVYSFVMKKTVMGRHTYALGGNEKAAMLSGVKTKRVTFWVFVNMGVLSALSGLIFAARLNAATPKAGVNFELDAIAASFIGGASASGGIGSVMGAIIGGLVMAVMNNGMSIMGIGIDRQQVIKGLVLMLAVAFDIYNKKKNAV
ncbi:sugar ABC transporter permease [Cohnella sp. CFH 77786]|uniref:multiple monosaccharide ABC transporter permease n=1 Tax=Cohnella sp. CFH 77786 TaxID=2662265 RepID=UPI001C60B530|nr:multiple monosaccharide ABC transporter permease [Cohnella sp. CFH 77786]MBW5447947.1 sugar ABC transporter permease [Cohnella sp. CFH 77786]